MSIPVLTDKAPERATYAITATYLDDDGVNVIPSAATWTLTDLSGNVINGRSAVAIATPSLSNTIVLSGADLAIGTYGINRELLVEYTYTSSLGAGLLGKYACRFEILNFTGVS